MFKSRVLILGVGNILLQDDGVGVHAIRALQERTFPEGVDLLDGGTAGVDLLPYIGEAQHLVVIDAVKGGGQPGAIYRLTPAVMGQFKEQSLSLHQVGFLEVLDLAEKLGHRPQTIIFGVEPQTIDWGLELTEPVQAVFPRLLELVVEEVEHGTRSG
ncbi:MAG: HyaD/HybD family hydrogenase maturation endopeptidase [Bacillota bacterium]